MAIGFLFNPPSPYQLSLEFHRKLKVYNSGKTDRDIMGVRIGKFWTCGSSQGHRR